MFVKQSFEFGARTNTELTQLGKKSIYLTVTPEIAGSKEVRVRRANFVNVAEYYHWAF